MTKLPDNSEQWRKACEQAVSFANGKEKMQLAYAQGYLAGHDYEHFGNEYCSLPEASREMEYLNTGDTYIPTVCHENGKCFVSSWGDWLEQAEREYCQAENVIRCANCGEFTPLDDSAEWQLTICKHCGRFVDGSHPLPQPEND